MYSLQQLDIRGYYHEPVPHTLFHQHERSSHAVMAFAGQNLNCQHPTLYYPTRELVLRGAETLLVDYSLRPAFSTFSAEEIQACIEADATAAHQALFREHAYWQVTLIGKSLGTLAMGHLLAMMSHLPSVRAIWLTPLLRRHDLRAQIQRAHPRSLFIIGTEDANYQAAELAELEQVTRGETLVLPGVGHLLEAADGIIPSLHVMEQIMQTIQAFLDRTSWEQADKPKYVEAG